MFTCSGIGAIPKDEIVEETLSGNNYYLNTNLITKNPYKDQRNHIRICIVVPKEFIEQAREAIQPGKPIHIRIGELSGKLTEKKYTFMTVYTKWKWIEAIKALPTKERKSYQDV